MNKFITPNQAVNQQIIAKDAEPCLVCASPTTTLHFQINICAACAAFYRRSVKIHKNYRCQRNTGKCNITVKVTGKPLCKYCRYHKCIEIGLKINSDNDAKDLHVINDPQIAKDFDSVFINVVNRFKHSQPVSTNFTTNFTQQFSTLLKNFVESKKPQNTPTLMKNDDIRLNYIVDVYTRSAQMLLNYHPFSTLPFKDKKAIHDDFWQFLHLLERIYQTCHYYGTDVNDERALVDQYQYIDNSKATEFLHDGIKEDGCAVFLLPIIERLRNTLKTYKKINPTFFEFAYICQLMLWSNFEIINLEESTNQLAQRIIHEISEDLHNYYLDELRLQVYANRQAQLYKIVAAIEALIREKKKLMKAKDIFDFGKNTIPYCRFDYCYYTFINKNPL